LDRLGNLISHLPAEAALLKAIPIPDTADERPWTRIEMLTAMLLEQADAAVKIQVKLWAKSPPKMKPLRIEWPGRDDQATAKQKPKASSPSEIASFMGSRRGTIQVIGGDDRGS
jgi:hypothetical protein